jgi:hypothetical protein
MAQMVGIGPFITIPLIISAIGGPQAIAGWVVGALIALFDGLVWAELGAAMPRSGGTYTFLREAYQYSTGRFMPFMFVWSTLLVTPLPGLRLGGDPGRSAGPFWGSSRSVSGPGPSTCGRSGPRRSRKSSWNRNPSRCSASRGRLAKQAAGRGDHPTAGSTS